MSKVKRKTEARTLCVVGDDLGLSRDEQKYA